MTSTRPPDPTPALSGGRRLRQVLCTMGPRWLGYRLWYAAQHRTGRLRRRTPCVSWAEVPLGTWLTDPSLAAPDAYRQYRRESAPPFLFDPHLPPGSPASAADFTTWDTRHEDGPAPSSPITQAEEILAGVFTLFGHHRVEAGFPPDWFHNALQDTPPLEPALRTAHWSTIPDGGGGDIKATWELNRFPFVFPLARAYGRTRDDRYAAAFWALVEDWRDHNPPHAGPNWMCGQEAALRLLAWCFGLHSFLWSAASTPERVAALGQMVAVSAARIEANFAYAISQRNNHGISEAMGLWTAGHLFPEFSRATTWRKNGRDALERLAMDLIYADGTFCQHSAVYHRLMLSNYLWVLSLARKQGPAFSRRLWGRFRAATKFLGTLLDRESGRIPLFGGNDGADILPLANADYLDFRPTVQAAQFLSNGERGLPPGPWDESLSWLGLAPRPGGTPPETTSDAHACVADFPDGGHLVLRGQHSHALVRCATRFRHRPAHADQLHVDLWSQGANLLRDGGSFSYNAPPWDTSFAGTAAHNTVEFDGHDQMPRISRFLFGAWMRVETVAPAEERGDEVRWAARCRDWMGCTHERAILLHRGTDTWTITDRVAGFRQRAVLRWRLDPGRPWALDGDTCAAPGISLRVETAPNAQDIELDQGWESLYYLDRRCVPMLTVRVAPPSARITTTLSITRS